MIEKIQYFKSGGFNLAGVMHLPKPRQKKAPLVVMNHGFTGNKSETHYMFTKLARALAENGIAAFRFDCFASGDSEGEYKDTNFYRDISDAKNAVVFAKSFKRIDKKRVGLFGMSKGGYISAILCGECKGIKAAGLMCAPADFPKLWDTRLGKNYKQNKIFDYSGLSIGKVFTEALYSLGNKNLESIAGFKNPLLIVHGTKDTVVEVSDAKVYYKISGSKKKKLVLVKGSDHGFSSIKWEKRLIALTVKHFKENL
ncbi:MAG: alpha/beta fold hydrolase [Candidatus Firestonebacteria bacterium]